MTQRPRFHLAFPVNDLAEARSFYTGLLGCPEGRSSDDWVDFDFFGHQIVAHLSPNDTGHKAHNLVDGDEVPVRHFGAILEMNQWRALAERLKENKCALRDRASTSVSKASPASRRRSSSWTPSGNALEFKAFDDDSRIFAK